MSEPSAKAVVLHALERGDLRVERVDFSYVAYEVGLADSEDRVQYLPSDITAEIDAEWTVSDAAVGKASRAWFAAVEKSKDECAKCIFEDNIRAMIEAAVAQMRRERAARA